MGEKMIDHSIKKDELFKEETDTNWGAWLKNPTDKFFLYSEGYLKSGEILYESILNPSDANTLVYPLVFNYRQFLELRLKELITMGYKFTNEKKDFENIHSLKTLWDTYRQDLLPQIVKIDDKILDIDHEISDGGYGILDAEHVILQFEKVDPISMNFRFHVTKGPNRKSSLSINTIDLKNFKAVIHKLISFLNEQWDMISHYQDLKEGMNNHLY